MNDDQRMYMNDVLMKPAVTKFSCSLNIHDTQKQLI